MMILNRKTLRILLDVVSAGIGSWARCVRNRGTHRLRSDHIASHGEEDLKAARLVFLLCSNKLTMIRNATKACSRPLDSTGSTTYSGLFVVPTESRCWCLA